MNAICERVIESCVARPRTGPFDPRRMPLALILGEYLIHYNRHGPYQAR